LYTAAWIFVSEAATPEVAQPPRYLVTE
jgi:hypothetical protein